MQQPLAYRMRPPTQIGEVVGQQHLVGPPGKIIDRW